MSTLSRHSSAASAHSTPRLGAAAQLLTGAEATAHAMRQIDPDVFPVYPITPQTPIIETFSKFVANGKATSEIVNAESEHSAMSIAIGSAAAGARTMTATASQGLALMIENVYIAASMRLPIVMAVGNRALSGPINIHCDHSDGMLARDSGAVQIYVENSQEAYDFMVMAPRIAEDLGVMLPVMVGQDGFTITHTSEVVELLDDELVSRFVGDYRIDYPLLDTGRVSTQGPFDMPDYYFEHKRQQADAMSAVPDAFAETADAFKALSGREYGILEPYRLHDAEYAIVVLGSSAGTIKEVVDELRDSGRKVGVLKIRLFRPFPAAHVYGLLFGLQAVAVLDRAMSFGSYGALYTEVAQALYGTPTRLRNYIYGLGGRDLYPDDIKSVFAALPDTTHMTEPLHYLGVRE